MYKNSGITWRLKTGVLHNKGIDYDPPLSSHGFKTMPQNNHQLELFINMFKKKHQLNGGYESRKEL